MFVKDNTVVLAARDAPFVGDRAGGAADEHFVCRARYRARRIIGEHSAIGQIDARARADAAAVRNRTRRSVFDVDCGAAARNQTTLPVRQRAAEAKNDAVGGRARNTSIVGDRAETTFDKRTEYLTCDGSGRSVCYGAVVLEINACPLGARSRNISGIVDCPSLALEKDPGVLSRNGPRRGIRDAATGGHENSVISSRQLACIRHTARGTGHVDAGAMIKARNGCTRCVCHTSAGEQPDPIVDSRGEAAGSPQPSRKRPG